ncbi:MAG TPA: DUF4097 family beta strand repeat-containing protein [Candidatus Acidoferrales bacterium]|nr:DUF4097 family beta strand repeat-containing protein [Candidatus Acidoferrales bacterium]
MNLAMRKLTKHLHFALAAFALALLTAAAPAPARAAAVDGHFDKTLTVSGPVNLEVTTGSGNITVRTGDSGKVEIHARIHANDSWLSAGRDAESRVQYIEQHPPVEQSGNTITIGHEEDHDLMRNISISYEITTPAETRLHSATGSGNQTVEGLNGSVESTTGSGDLKLSNIGGDTTSRAGSGDVTISNVKGAVHAASGSGSIQAEGVTGAMNASTGSGDIILTQTGAGDVEASSGSGSVKINGVKGAVRVGTGSGNIRAQGTPTGNWRLHTGSGDLTVELPEKTSFELYAHTSSGSIHSKFPITVQGTISPRDLHGQVGSGGPTVELRTSSGTIHIESR